MKKENYLIVLYIVCLFSLISFCILSYFISKYNILSFDSIIIYKIQLIESPVLTMIMKTFTFVGSTKTIWFIYLIIIIVLFYFLNYRYGILLSFFVMIGSNILFVLLKLLFERPRPYINQLIDVSNYSFPSGHATMALSLYGILILILWRSIKTRLVRIILVTFCIFMILAIGVSRIYLGVHYPSDILAGYFLSIFWLSLIFYFYHFFKKER